MSININSLCTFQDIIDHGGLAENSSIDNNLIEHMINEMTSTFHITSCVKQFKSKSYEERHDGDDTNYLFLYNIPILTVDSIYNDEEWVFDAESLISSDDYILKNDHVILKSGIIFSKGNQNIKIIYSSGYAENSNELLALKRRCIIEVSLAFNRRGQEDVSGRSDQFGNVSYT